MVPISQFGDITVNVLQGLVLANSHVFTEFEDSEESPMLDFLYLCYYYMRYGIPCIYIYIISRRIITPQQIKYSSTSLDVVQSLYFGSKLSSSGT